VTGRLECRGGGAAGVYQPQAMLRDRRGGKRRLDACALAGPVFLVAGEVQHPLDAHPREGLHVFCVKRIGADQQLVEHVGEPVRQKPARHAVNDRRWRTGSPAGVVAPLTSTAMSLRTDTFDLGGLRLAAGEGRRLDLRIGVEPLVLAGERYPVQPSLVHARLNVSRTAGQGFVLRLRFDATIEGPCMRCLEPAKAVVRVDASEVSQEGEREELSSPYMQDGVLDAHAWARDALALSLPAKLLCREDCAGLCSGCGANLNDVGPEHRHEREPDPRWAKLSELRLE